MSCNDPLQLRLPIGIEGISCLTYLPEPEQKLVLGTTDGRVRIYRSLDRQFECFYKKRWHKSIRCLSLLPSTKHLVSASSQSGLKVHDVESGRKIWAQLHAHKRSPISSLLCISPVMFVTGDEDAVVQVWDVRKPGAACHALRIQDDEPEEEDLFGAVNDMAFGDSHNLVLAALDNGSLAALNLRKARVEVMSDTLGFSARTVTVIKNNKTAVVGTEDGAICLFNWNEFELCADRFSPFVQKMSKGAMTSATPSTGSTGSPSVEKIVKVTEDMVAVATDDGKVSAVYIRPNEVLGMIGRHPGSEGDYGADCINLAVSPCNGVLASVCPDSSIVKFWPLADWINRSEHLKSNPPEPKKKRRKVNSNALSPDRAEYLSGLLPEKVENGDSESESASSTASDCEEDSDSSSE